MLEYDVTLTGVVANQQIMTLEGQGSDEDANPFNLLVDLGKRSITAIAGLSGLMRRSGEEPPKSKG